MLSIVAALLLAIGPSVGFSPKVGAEALRAAHERGGARVIVMLAEPDVAASSLSSRRARIASLQQHVLDALAGSGFELRSRWRTIPGFSATVGQRALAILASDPDVRRVDLDVGGSANLTESRPLIRADVVERMGYTGAGVTVAILDTGVPESHPDLASKIVSEACFCTNADQSGCCPDGESTQFGSGAAADGAGHGSNVAGIVAGEGTVAPRGMAPGVAIVAVKVIDDQNRFANSSQVIDGLDYIISEHPEVNVVNMSLGTDARFSGYCDAAASWTMAFASAIDTLRARGTIVFVSAGNDADPHEVEVPACVRNAVAVGAVWDSNVGSHRFSSICTDATTQADQITCFSNSSDAVDLLAPGAAITAVGRNGVSTYYGTSQAAPHCAGLAALMLEAKPTLTPDQIESVMKSTGVPITDPRNGRTLPRIDAYAAVTGICDMPTITEEPADESITAGSSATLVVTTTGATGYQWYQATGVDDVGDTSKPVGSGAATFDTGTLPAGTFYFWVRATNTCGSADSRIVTVTARSISRRRTVRRPG